MINRWFPLGVSAGALLGYLASLPDTNPYLHIVLTGMLVVFGVIGYVLSAEFMR